MKLEALDAIDAVETCRDPSQEPTPIPCQRCSRPSQWRWWESPRPSRRPSRWRRPAPVCPECQADIDAALARADYEQRLRRAHIPERYWQWAMSSAAPTRDRSETLAQMVAGGQVVMHQGNAAAWQALSRLIEMGGRGSMVLEGEVGTGKTLMLSVLACQLLRPGLQREEVVDSMGHSRLRTSGGISVVYTSEPALLAETSRLMRDHSKGGRESLIDHAERARVLILDELGARAGRKGADDWGATVIEEIIDARFARGLPIVAATNLTQPQLQERLGARSYSRLASMAVDSWYRLGGGDWRVAVGAA